MRIIFLIIIGIHLGSHLLGFKLIQPVSMTFSGVWYLSLSLLVLTGTLYALRSRYWWPVGMVAVLISQILILYFWEEAWFVTIGNALVLLATVNGYAAWRFENLYTKDVKEGLERTRIIKSDLLTESDLESLPAQVQKYLKYTGIVNKPKVNNVRIVFEAAMRNKDQDWFQLASEQYNFFDRSERLFFLNGLIKGLPAAGYHRYKNGTASMVIKLMSFFPVINVKGDELYKAETVTAFNDMCVFAPATLIDKRIHWESLDNVRVKASFSNPGITISAILYFNDAGQLVNFVSDDRFDVSTMKNYRFSTPLGDYRKINGYTLCGYGEAAWHYPEGEFTYGRFTVKDIEYNVAGY